MLYFGSIQEKGARVFLFGRLASFLFCLLRRIESKVYLPLEGDWEAINEFDFTGKTLLGLCDLMRKTQFRNSALRVAKVTVHVERERERERERGREK